MFDQQGKDPTEGWKMLGGKCVKRMYEKGVKGYVHHIGGPPGLKMQLPADERRGRERPPAFSPALFPLSATFRSTRTARADRRDRAQDPP
jgi:hypothetical protein